ncbi:hypothetical protein L596_003257 [Steinernema carpocapsae]|uniref:Uncharacterized protein n=1 Tax=Steinernema carpocapsae TaxID=34508 RepID=A0A4U8URW7_STECR|nr:hypothetical protein L596_003257 [Steinernema carpocapsae]
MRTEAPTMLAKIPSLRSINRKFRHQQLMITLRRSCNTLALQRKLDIPSKQQMQKTVIQVDFTGNNSGQFRMQTPISTDFGMGPKTPLKEFDRFTVPVESRNFGRRLFAKWVANS